MTEGQQRPPTEEEAAKTKAEARNLDAQTEREAVEVERLRAEIAKLDAEAREAEARADSAASKAALDRLLREEAERKVREIEATDYRNFVYRFDDVVGEKTVQMCMNVLTVWHRMEPRCAMELRLNSPGGSVIEGMALFDFLRELARAGHRITTAAYGYAASMAGILLQAGDSRVMARESWLLIHELSSGAIGTLGQMIDEVEWLKRIDGRAVDIFYQRSRGAPKALSRAEIKRRYERKDWWISSEEALGFGFIDEIR